ncbi:hypothetical protein FHW12_002524 [Dokdonella fugitiva]|uniref:Signal transduction histidine kinase internal region domain-containing protein n=1 Tax=Dokdonella fugitiva TaxID=328517 RepID=A0A839F5E7_9GAMM|nr:histidine kinase [Dokdonella fugitiva]MBA8888300.1 hypothetical protein [Dokdonella fugitiva]
MQSPDDERRVGMTNDAIAPLLALVGGAFALWLVLFGAYRIDRPDAVGIATATVLLVVPPLASYYLAMEATRAVASLAVRIAAVFALALAWLVVQRAIVYPAFGFVATFGESAANLVLLPTFGIAAWFGVRALRYRRRLSQALALQAQTELRLLEAQLAPHMLFNMLNTVYAVLLTDRDKAVPLFLSMAEALRHVVDRTRKPWIALRDELDFIEHYATLERARHPESVAVRVDAQGDLDVPVPPMLLATLFENAVKHGRFDDGTLEVDVQVRVDEARIVLAVENRVPSSAPAAGGLGVGHANIRQRLALVYPGRSRFDADLRDARHRAVIEIVP